MADEVGFLDSIGVGSQDERELFEERRRLAEESAVNRTGASSRQFSRGENIGAGLFGAIRNLIKPAEGRGRGVKDTINAGAAASRNMQDQQAAQAAGITVDDLKGRRALRKDINSFEADQSTVDGRIQLAEYAAKRAMEHGQGDAQYAALDQLTNLRKEKLEFTKLAADSERAENLAIESSLPSVWVNGSKLPVAGQYGKKDGVHGIFANGKFYGPGEFSLEDPAGKNNETLDQRWRKIIPAGDRTQLSAMITTGNASVRQYRRVLSTIIDLSEEGGVNSVLSTSGNVLSWVDNAVRNVQGILDPILGSTTYDPATGKKESSAERRKGVIGRGMDAASDFWLDEGGQSILPEQFRDASAAAQQHRAMIMELAYLAARMAEPSNRGLSDNDIKNAMRRIAGGTSNPQVMMRRFAEMTFDGAAQIEDAIDVHRGKFSDVSREEFDEFVGGDSLSRYRTELDSLQKDFGFDINADGRATFTRQLDADIQPGQGVSGLSTAPGTDVKAEPALSDEEFLRNLRTPTTPQ